MQCGTFHMICMNTQWFLSKSIHSSRLIIYALGQDIIKKLPQGYSQMAVAFFKYDLRLTKENEASLSLNNNDRAAHVHYSWAYTRNNSTRKECTNFISFF
eukprot:TRINITY_DN23391_c1_g1_i1.p1 TRINITY_DN23391_c1_g1~~TRINITY_DN23391_c1_g1_i1.p1  ORF type:complete len:100 (+),score=6.11 TRINITY_DN23391_c1_g1_i1:328-627(+)